MLPRLRLSAPRSAQVGLERNSFTRIDWRFRSLQEHDLFWKPFLFRIISTISAGSRLRPRAAIPVSIKGRHAMLRAQPR
jgi:hypothetical protein